ncbi:MAG: FAD-binding oxidoreductase [Flavobacteriales bacterium]
MNPTTNFKQITLQDKQYFYSFLSDNQIIEIKSEQKPYAKDETEDLEFYPDLVLIAKTTLEVSQVAKYCNEQQLPLTVRGAGTGLSGGALPVCGGVVLSLEKMNQVVDFDEENFQITVETGIINEELRQIVEAKGLFYPPDPASKGSCTIGGNIAFNSGGPKALKYGVTSHYILNLEVVLADGSIVWTGANTLKNSTGYNLTQLVVGSEGTLAIATKAVLKLIPKPKHQVLLLASFTDSEWACRKVSEIFHLGITPSAIEFLERDAIEWTLNFLDLDADRLKPETQAQLLIELEGNELEHLQEEAERVAELLDENVCNELFFADNAREKDQLWEIRRKVGEAVKSNSIYKEEDTVVPRSKLPALLKKVKQLGHTYGFRSVCYGHAGDGNLHINIVKEDLSDKQWNEELPQAIRQLFEFVCSIGGTISGEHGIGLVQKNYMDIAFNPKAIDIQRQIKNCLDPKGILNPKKMFPDS